MSENTHEKILKTWVIFSGQADMTWLKILKPGFRHCSVLFHDGSSWITYDPLSNFTDITVHDVPAEFNLPQWMRERGHTVIETQRQFPAKPAPLAFFSCVSAVKRILGLHKRFIITPWQLYRYLTKSNYSNFNTYKKGVFSWEV